MQRSDGTLNRRPIDDFWYSGRCIIDAGKRSYAERYPTICLLTPDFALLLPILCRLQNMNSSFAVI